VRSIRQCERSFPAHHTRIELLPFEPNLLQLPGSRNPTSQKYSQHSHPSIHVDVESHYRGHNGASLNALD
jgi:hypothetical protein